MYILTYSPYYVYLLQIFLYISSIHLEYRFVFAKSAIPNKLPKLLNVGRDTANKKEGVWLTKKGGMVNKKRDTNNSSLFLY